MPDGTAPVELTSPGSGYDTVSVFTSVPGGAADGQAVLPLGDGRTVSYPIAPFLGMMGVAPDTADPVPTRPPGRHGGNLDVRWLTSGSTLYLPVEVAGARFAVGDPHFAQGNGEVSLTALEGSLRADLRLSVLRGPEAEQAVGLIANPMVETDEHWIPIGLDADLDEALREAVRQALRFLETRIGMPRHLAYAYLSAAADFEVSQVVNDVKGVHCRIRKRDFD
jgi:acetamidase/formamidase